MYPFVKNWSFSSLFITHIFFCGVQNLRRSFYVLLVTPACVSFEDCVSPVVVMDRSPLEISGTWFYSLQRWTTQLCIFVGKYNIMCMS